MPAPSFIQELHRNARVVITEERILAGRARADDTEIWHEVGASGEVGFVNGWQHFSATTKVAFRMDRSGFVHLRGLAKGPSSSGHIFTLPNSWAPDYLHQFPVQRTGLQFGEVLGLYVHADGRVELQWFGGTNDYTVFLDNYRWRGKL